ncbi:fimbrial protein [Hafnia alvei]|uniref:Fimbrial protein n=1 Tax=Hafnia alvei ATCC 51873 TaxID=1002364 RepID=G9Y5I7_HAFAL|nr:fimbrial protein [Hafnia alvei]EHM43656.1 fimbrial protein [Hafnia alvei ATCC 51873]QQE44149.1 fimbrial protein [Hafnia alvei]
MQNKKTATHVAFLQLSKRCLVLMFSIFPLFSQAATTVLQNCFPAPVTYTINTETELPPEENQDGYSASANEHITGNGPAVVANCTCPYNLYASTTIYETTAASSPLPPGTNGYGYLTEHLDINVTAYGNAINSPDGSGLPSINIDTYPTPIAGMNSAHEVELRHTEGTSDVCSDATKPTDASSTKRSFKWNVLTFGFYIKKAILGEELIPPTVIVQNYSCLSFGNYCSVTDTQWVSSIQVTGKLTAPLSCTINAGSTIEVELGNIVTSQFVSQGEPPSNYTLKDVDITYHCDDPAAANAGKIKFSLTADQGVAAGSNNLIAKMLDRDDIGVRMYDQNNNDIVLDGSLDLPITLDTQGNGKISMTATPVSTTSSKPQPGKFEGNVTVKMELR